MTSKSSHVGNYDRSHDASTTMMRLFALVGALFIAKFLFSVARFLLSLYVLPGKSLRSFGPSKKTWAVVTGASDGIGREFALQLAQAGYAVLLVSRTASKLDAVAAEIASKSATPTRTLAIDFAADDDADYERLEEEINDITKHSDEIAILINNVGLSHSMPVPFSETPLNELRDIITINCTATLRVTQIVLAKMMLRKKKTSKGSGPPGLILTMGSFGGLLPTPLLATYSGSKAFLQQWSTALGAELEAHNITVELVQSYMISTAMSKIRKASAFVPTPRDYVRAVLSKIGRTVGAQGYTYSSNPFWSHAYIQFGAIGLVGVHNRLLLAYNLWMHKGIRKRALKKRAAKNGAADDMVNVEGGQTKVD